MAKNLRSLLSPLPLAPLLYLFLIPAVLCVGFNEVQAQQFSFSLEDLDPLFPDSPLDTIKADPAYLPLGQTGRVPNFLDTDFTRERSIVEYSLDGLVRFSFRVPNQYRFEFEESRDGAFIVMTPRDLNTPGLSIHVATVDQIIQDVRRQSLADVWRETIVTSINTQEASEQGKKGLLNIDIPLNLPGAVESIIGKGEATNIDISGRESITFAGESRRVSPYIGVEGQTKQPIFPSLDLKQELDVRLNGQIGEKINVQVDHSSNSTLSLDNRIRLNYTGFEDDIVQLIEMGNTSLSLPGSQLVNFSGNAQGLFGIKGVAQIGPNKLTVIASKEEGEVSRATFTPRGGQITQTEVRRINDSDFIKNTYFFLDAPDMFSSPPVDRFPKEDSIEVFESVEPFEIAADPDIIPFFGRAWVDSLNDGSNIRTALALLEAGFEPPPFQERQFRELSLENGDYDFVRDALTQQIIGIELARAVGDTRVLGVRYINDRSEVIGNFGDFADTLALEIIKPYGARPDNAFGYTWSYMMRNIYSLQLASIDPATVEIDIIDFNPRLDQTIPEGYAIPWIRIFGLDLTDQAGTGPPDNRVDVNSNLIDFSRGELRFPILTPFNPSDQIVAAFTDSLFAFTGPYANSRRPDLYDQYLSDQVLTPKFQIVVSAASTSRTFSLNAFNIADGSEVVHLDGRTLARNRDYRIDYETGEIELIGTVLDELTPNSNIAVDYEYTPFIGGGSSTLMGFNDLLSLTDHATFGTTWLYESKSSPAQRPRLGEEPTRAVVGNVSTSLNYNPGVLTTIANWLPLVNTDARSSLTFAGEVAVSMPDPNTLGQVYIDDFEGVEDSDLISLSRRSWEMPSLPVVKDSMGFFTTYPDSTRVKAIWYNIEPDRSGQKSGVSRRDLNPELDERESTLVQSLDIEFLDIPTDTTMWGGVMAGFRGGGLDLSQGQFIELWVNDFRGADEAARGGILHIDLGSIDENFYRPDIPRKFDTEDPNYDGFVALNEDTGLDGIPDGESVTINNVTYFDDPDDDWDLSRLGAEQRFLKINGTEGNRIFDSEDLDGTGTGEWENAYFSYQIDLASEPVTDIRKSFPTNVRFNEPPHANDSWRLYRIRLSDFVEIDKSFKPSFEQIKHIRIWVENIGEVVDPNIKRLQIAEFKIVGNRWEKDGIRTLSDSLLTSIDVNGAEFSLGVISTKTDPVDYTPPFRPNEQNDIAEKEQSLLVAYDSLRTGQSLRIRKRFAASGLDFSTYRDMQLFAHTGAFNPDVEYFFQVATDSLNYYEIALPLTQEFFPATGWTVVHLGLTDLTQLKLIESDSLVTGTVKDLVANRVYEVRMKGNPSLFNVRFLYAGLRNRGTQSVSGDMWVNDIVLGDRRKDPDFAERVSGTLSMANVINLTGSYSHTGADFRGLRQTRGSGAETEQMSVSLKTGVGNFIPLFGFAIPVTANYARNVSYPKFTPNSDTEIRNQALRTTYRSESTIRGFSTTLTRTGSKNKIFRYTFDKLKLNFSWSQSRAISPATADTATTMSGTADYSISWGPRRTVRLFKDIRFRYWLNSLNLRANASRREAVRYRNVGGLLQRDPVFYAADIGTSLQANYIPFPSLTSTFRMAVNRDYARPHQWQGFEIGTETDRNQSFQASYKAPDIFLIGMFKPDFAYSSGYREDQRPNVRLAGDPPGVMNVSTQRDISVKMSFDIGKYFKRAFEGLGLGEPQPEAPTPPQPAGQTEADTTQTEEEKPYDKWIAVKRIGGVLSRIRRINGSFNQRGSSAYNRIAARPGFGYQFGLWNNSGVEVDGVAIDTPEQSSRTNTFMFDSGVQITQHIDLAARYSTTLNNQAFRAQDSNSRSTTWPDVNVSWSGLEKLGPLQGLFTTTTATLGYTVSTRQSGTGGQVNSTERNMRLTPTLVFTWKNGLNSTANMSLQKTTNQLRGSFTETDALSINMELKYNFAAGKAFKIPLPGLRNKILRSSLNTSLQMGYTRAGGRRSLLGSSVLQKTPGRTSLRIAPRVTYNFTNALNGGFFIDFSRSFSEATDQTTTVTRVGLDATFSF